MATYKEISYGSKDTALNKELQTLLNNNGYNLEVDGSFGPKTQAAVKDYQKANGLKVDGIVGENTWGALNKSNTTNAPSNSITQAENMLNQLQNPGTSTWQNQLDDAINKIMNREKFSYDLNGDALYQQYKDKFTTQGKMASMDVMGQAAAMTGGYGNSYAQSVGQQAYQGQLQQLNDKVPELYALAYDRYNQEGQDLLNDYALIAAQEAKDYDRAIAERDWQHMLDREKVQDEQWQKTFDESARQFDKSYNLSLKQSQKPTGPSGYEMTSDQEKKYLGLIAGRNYEDAEKYLEAMRTYGMTDDQVKYWSAFLPEDYDVNGIDPFERFWNESGGIFKFPHQ